jgi:hypothetical protein
MLLHRRLFHLGDRCNLETSSIIYLTRTVLLFSAVPRGLFNLFEDVNQE